MGPKWVERAERLPQRSLRQYDGTDGDVAMRQDDLGSDEAEREQPLPSHRSVPGPRAPFVAQQQPTANLAFRL